MSIRARVTVIAVAAVVFVSVVAGVALVVSQRGVLVDQLDEGLEADAERLVASVDAGLVPPLGDDDDRLVAVVVDGQVIVATEEIGPDALVQLAEADDGGVTIDGEGHRAARVQVERGHVVVAAPTEDVDDAVAALARTILLVLALVTVALGAVVWILVGRTLRPVERIRAEVDTIGLEDLGRRVPEPGTGDEIARLAVTMNEMLGRLERSAERQRQFVADASHELRTPLARMRADLELSDERPQGEPSGRPMLDDVLALQHLVDDLLVLARNDADLRGTRRRIPVDLDDIVSEEAAAMRDVDTSHVSAAQVHGDVGALRRVVRNLLDNATRHAAGTVAVALEEIDGAARLIVDDDGPGIPAEHRDEVFERFRRLDDARTSTSGRSGLGLAIVRSVVAQHGGTVTIADSPLGGARVTVHLPVAPIDR